MLLLGTHSYNVLGECVWSLHKETFNCFCLRCVFQLAILYSMFLKLFIVIPLSSWRYIHGPNTTFSFLRDQCIIMQFKSQYLSYLVPNSCTCHLLWSSFFQGLWSVEPHLSLQVWQHTIHVMQCDGFVHLAQTNLDPGPSWGGGRAGQKNNVVCVEDLKHYDSYGGNGFGIQHNCKDPFFCRCTAAQCPLTCCYLHWREGRARLKWNCHLRIWSSVLQITNGLQKSLATLFITFPIEDIFWFKIKEPLLW